MKIIKRNQIVIAVIALMLATAGYLNYSSDYNNNYISASPEVDETSIAGIGDAKLVSSNDIVEQNTVTENVVEKTNATVTEENTDQYFSNSRLEREKMYSQILESYQKLLESSSVSAEQKSISSNEITNINNTKNAIMISENLIKTKGFSDCVIFLNDKSISVIVKSKELKQEEVAQIQNIVSREMKASIENIHISNK